LLRAIILCYIPLFWWFFYRYIGWVGWAMYKESEVNGSENSVEWLKSLGVSGDKVFVGLLVGME
jgi:hypothetical protein